MRKLLLALLATAAACSEPLDVPDDLPDPDAVADVTGQVLKASGAPVQSGIVTIRCANDQFGRSAPINPEGQYNALIGAEAEMLDGTGRALCVFTAVGSIRVERTLVFGSPASPPPVQVVNLQGA
jgi:hypothetical protein